MLPILFTFNIICTYWLGVVGHGEHVEFVDAPVLGGAELLQLDVPPLEGQGTPEYVVVLADWRI